MQRLSTRDRQRKSRAIRKDKLTQCPHLIVHGNLIYIGDLKRFRV